MTGSELRYSAEQLGNDWEDKYIFVAIQVGGGIGFLVNAKLAGSVGIAIDDKKRIVYFASINGSAGLGFGASGEVSGTIGYNQDPKKDARSVLGLMGGFGAGVTGVAVSGEFDVDVAGTLIGNIGAGTKYGWHASVDANLGYTWGITQEELYKQLKKVNISKKQMDILKNDMLERMEKEGL